MKFTLRFKKINGLLYFFMISFFVFSCGSYQYVGIYEDGIYSDDDSSNQNSSLNTNDYYTDYFKGKAIEYESNDFFTDVESYTGNYNNAENFYSENAGWGQNNDPNVVINIQTRPDYGMFWGWNNWGWNNWRWNNWGWNNWGYPVFGLYDPYFYNSLYIHNNGFRQNHVQINGHRNNVNSVLGYRTRSLAETSALGTVTKGRTRNTRTRSYSNSENNVRFKSNERTKNGSNVRLRNSSNSLYSNDEIRKYRRKNNNQNPKRYNNSSNSRSRSYNNSRPTTRPPAVRSSTPRTSSRSRGGG